MPLKNQKKKLLKGKSLEINKETVTILRTVEDEEAFYFYEALGKPTGESAKSLSDFLAKIKSAKLESLMFHLQREDFQNWVKKTLGDPKLARKLNGIKPSYDDNLRIKIHATVENRIEELRKA
jgi:hypothetical protein